MQRELPKQVFTLLGQLPLWPQTAHLRVLSYNSLIQVLICHIFSVNGHISGTLVAL